jgi:hypothetical protein
LIRYITLLVTVFILSLSSSALAADELDSGTIEGVVINGTADGGSVAGQNVTLQVFLDDIEMDSASTATDAEGQFVFSGLSTEPGYGYQVELTFQGADYYGEWFSFIEGESLKSIQITVYDSTTSEEAISVAAAHTIIYIQEGSLLVEEYLFFMNESDRTFIGSKEVNAEGDKETLRFSVSKQATELQVSSGLMSCCIVGSDEGFSYTMPVLPGFHEVAYSYVIDYTSGEHQFSRGVIYPTARFDLMVQGGSTAVVVDQLTAEEPLDINGTEYSHLTGLGLTPGDTLVVQLSGLLGSNSERALTWVIVTLTMLILGVSVIYWLRKRRFQPVESVDSLEQKRQQLFGEIAQLDDDFGEGKIDEEVYHRLRTVAKAQLMELMPVIKEKSSDA